MFTNGNPYMRRWARRSARGEMHIETEPASYKGVTKKSTLLVLLTIGVAIVTEVLLWRLVFNVMSDSLSTDALVRLIVIASVGAGIAGVAMIVGSVVVVFNPSAAKFYGPFYAVMQGLFLGFLTGFLNLFLPGVPLAALLATGVVFAMCLVFYKLLGVRIKSGFLRGTVIALISFFVVEILCIPIVYFVVPALVKDITISTNVLLGVQAGLALFCVIFACITVYCDIQNIDYMVQAGADKKYEWVLALSLTSSLIYLYVEFLELIVRVVALIAINGRKN